MSHFAPVEVLTSHQESSHQELEQAQNAGDSQLSDVQQVTMTSTCHVSFIHSIHIACYKAIRATDLTLGLRRIPAGFYVIVQANDVQWQTINKRVHVGLDILEWND